ncbi:hypothetical protein MP228_002208 [Amoeboaphelidium protococcarum]|nr:hypothetical protein MP228_002208 [Amoeboaphelidium protococcarum]
MQKVISQQIHYVKAVRALSTDAVFDGTKAQASKKVKSAVKKPSSIVQEGTLQSTTGPSFIPPDERTVPRLKHRLDRVLFNPGVHFLRDIRSKVYNFDPYVRFITQPQDFDFSRIPPFRRPSQDETLAQLASENNARFFGSTSSVSSALSQIYLGISQFKDIQVQNLGFDFQNANTKFTEITRLPTSVLLKPSQIAKGIYSIDYYSMESKEKESIMMQQGVILENFFTLSKEDYGKFLVKNKSKVADATTGQSDDNGAYAYCNYKGLLLRSQIDCMNPHLPRKVFDIKTRASVAIRLNSQNYEDFVNYRIDKIHGWYNSFSREYYDMLRSAFLKYNFQVRIGNMDGLFVSYHNTREIFGFQYVSREELDLAIFGSTALADKMFTLSLGVFDTILNDIVAANDGQQMLVSFAAGKAGIKVYARQHEVEKPFVTKYIIHTDTLIDDEPVESLDTVTEDDDLVVSYRVRKYKDSFLEEHDALLARVAKRFNREKSFGYDAKLRSEFAPYMTEDEEEDQEENETEGEGSQGGKQRVLNHDDDDFVVQ